MTVGDGSVVWISGATAGVGAGLARTVPFPGARIVNLSRGEAAGVENVRLDLTDPDDWDRVAEHFADTLAGFTGRRAMFIHNAFQEGPYGFAGEVDPGELKRHLLANHAAAIYLGDSFVRACPPGVDACLVMISSLSAKIPMLGAACYSACKAGVEMWTRTVGHERRRRAAGPWLIAFRLGLIDSPGVRQIARVDPADCPAAGATRDSVERGDLMSADEAGRQMWSVIEQRPESGSIVEVATLPETIRAY